MNDNQLSKNNGKFFTIIDNDLGHGAYGQVFMGKNEFNKKLAIKCCKFDESGIPNILEASIMKTIQHATINSAIEIVCSSTTLYIIQDLAITDLHQYTNMYKQNHKCNREELDMIFSSLLQAVSILHHHNIIHCDIKASNVLMFENGVKLADFSLATYKSNELYTHTVCTSSHRSLEAFLKLGFNHTLDIWSLGCTFYEIAFQELLFVNQGVDKLFSKKKSKEMSNKKYINAILDWAKHTNQSAMIHYNISYTSIHIKTHEYDKINQLISKMLIVDQNRPEAIHLLKEFYPIQYDNPKLITNKCKEITHAEQARIIRYIQQISEDEIVQTLAYKMYTQLTIDDISEYYKAVGVTWISLKLITGSQPILYSIDCIPPDQLLILEKKICIDLHFRLT